MRHTAALANFARTVALEDVPADVVDKVKVHILDQLGAQLLGAQLPWSLGVRAYCMQYARSAQSTVVGSGETIDAEFAALANATAGHGFEVDDYHAGLGHPGCVAVPAALAVAEEQGTTGADFLASTIISFEIISRVGLAALPSMMVDRVFHSTCAVGLFGSAAGAARLMRLSEEKILAAMSIAGSHASGTVEYSQSGGEVKRLHAGMGAAGGVRSARVAAHGMTAPSTILEGKRGFLQAFANAPSPERLTQDLGRKWELLDLRVQPYSVACGTIFHEIDALRVIS